MSAAVLQPSRARRPARSVTHWVRIDGRLVEITRREAALMMLATSYAAQIVAMTTERKELNAKHPIT